MPRSRSDVIRLLPAMALAALALATLVGFLAYPTYPNYDSYYSLLWGRELLHGEPLSFQTYYAPTEHPLAIAFGALLSLLGTGADRVLVFCTLVAFVLLCAGLYRVGRLLFTPLVGLLAAVVLLTRFDFPFLAARGYVDIPYLALIVWALALEIARPGRGGPVWALLVAAGLLRPEAWLLLGVYGLWLAVRARREGGSWPGVMGGLLRSAAIASIAPVVWCGVDYLATGDPLFSLTHTSSFAEELGRSKSAADIPQAMRTSFFNLVKAPVVAAAIAGALLGLWTVPRRVAVPAVVWLIGSGTFFLIGIAGFSVIDRYLLVPALMMMLLAAVAIGGFTMLERSWLRRAWAAVALLAVAYGAAFVVVKVNFHELTNELERRGRSHEALVALIERAGARMCPPVAAPNHKLVPELRWVMGLGDGQVLARQQATGARDAHLAAPERRRRGRVAERLRAGGSQVYIVERGTLFKQGLVGPQDDVFNEIPVWIDRIPADGYRRLAANAFYSVYTRCPEPH